MTTDNNPPQPADVAGVPDPTLRPEDMSNDELNAAMDYHRRQSARYSNERAKMWRFRLEMKGGPEEIDIAMENERRARRAAQPATTPSDLISRDAAMRTICHMCARPERYGPAVPIEGSQRLFHFQIADDWNAGQCDAQAIKELPSVAPSVTTPSEPVELFPDAPERIYLHRDPQGLWRRTAFGDLLDTLAYVPEPCTTPLDVTERARRAAKKVAAWAGGDGRPDGNAINEIAKVIAAEFERGE